MKDTTLFSLMLALPEPWELTEIVPNLTDRTLTLRVKRPHVGQQTCPLCHRPLEIKGHGETVMPCPWDVMEFRAMLVFEEVRAVCRVHGAVATPVLPELARFECALSQPQDADARLERSVS